MWFFLSSAAPDRAFTKDHVQLRRLSSSIAEPVESRRAIACLWTDQGSSDANTPAITGTTPSRKNAGR
jgi:hypothetical protein